MSTDQPSGSGGIGRRIEGAVDRIDLELRHAVAYMNDAVVPQVRRESITAMRKMAATLEALADRFDSGNFGSGGGNANPASSRSGAPSPPKSQAESEAARPAQNPFQDPRP